MFYTTRSRNRSPNSPVPNCFAKQSVFSAEKPSQRYGGSYTKITLTTTTIIIMLAVVSMVTHNLASCFTLITRVCCIVIG